jgi:hypothetical protein
VRPKTRRSSLFRLSGPLKILWSAPEGHSRDSLRATPLEDVHNGPFPEARLRRRVPDGRKDRRHPPERDAVVASENGPPLSAFCFNYDASGALWMISRESSELDSY